MKAVFVAAFVLIVGCVVMPSVVTSLKVDIQKEFIMTPPSKFPYCHVCSIAERDDGGLVAVFQAGNGEGQPDSTIYSSIRDAQSGKWSDLRIAAKRDDICCMNPCLYLNDQGKIFVTFHSGGDEFVQKGHCSTHSWSGFFTASDDGGITWNKSLTPLPKDCLGCIKNKCVKLENGEVLCPSSTESILEHTIGVWMAHFETTDSQFSQFERRHNIEFYYSPETGKVCQGIIQPTIFDEGGGRVFALFRSSCGILAQAWSSDYGRSWPAFASSSPIPNPGAGIDGIVMKNAKNIGYLLAFNNATQHRTPLTLAHSVDAAASWKYIADVETDPDGTFAYPALIQSKRSPNVAHLCYTYDLKGQRNMMYARLNFTD